jgi:hypothetical protein
MLRGELWLPPRCIRRSRPIGQKVQIYADQENVRRPVRKPIADKQARNAAAAAHDQIGLLKARLAKLEKYADRIASFVDDHIEGLA